MQLMHIFNVWLSTRTTILSILSIIITYLTSQLCVLTKHQPGDSGKITMCRIRSEKMWYTAINAAALSLSVHRESEDTDKHVQAEGDTFFYKRLPSGYHQDSE